MAVKKKGTARRKQRAARKVTKAARRSPKKIVKPASVARRIQRGPALPATAAPQGDGDSTPLHDSDASQDLAERYDYGATEDIH